MDGSRHSPNLPADRGGARDQLAQDRCDTVVEMVREISRQSDPQAMISVYRKRMMKLFGGDGSLSISRRDLSPPAYRITRSTRWTEEVNPWTQPEKLPLCSGGLLADLLYQDGPKFLRDISVARDDPAYEYLQDVRSLMYLPLYDGGEALNAVVRVSSDPVGFDEVQLADALLTANLFGRATNNLLVAQRLQVAYAELDRELKQVAEIQRSLLPPRLPDIPGLDLAVSYKTAARAGGDYYDFFDLGDDRWGILIADVSGHGTPAAVVMAVLRTILHARCHQCRTPGEVLSYANTHLCDQSNPMDGTFATAFFAIYDCGDRSLRYASAGHNPPLLVRRGQRVFELDQAQSLPLAVQADTSFIECSTRLAPSDTLILYTDGITEAFNEDGEMYGRRRLLSCVREDAANAQHIIDCVVHKLLAFTNSRAQDDDQTLLAMRVT